MKEAIFGYYEQNSIFGNCEGNEIFDFIEIYCYEGTNHWLL